MARPFAPLRGGSDEPGVSNNGALGEELPGEPAMPSAPSLAKRRRTRSRSVRLPKASTVRSTGAMVFVLDTLRMWYALSNFQRLQTLSRTSAR